MSLASSRVRWWYAGCSVIFLAISVASMLRLLGDEQDAKPRGTASEGERSNTGSPAGEASAARGAEEVTDGVSAVLSEMTDRELLSFAQGGELPAKLQAIDNSDRISEALLRELAERLNRDTGRTGIGSSSAEPLSAVERENGAAGRVGAGPPPDLVEPQLSSVTVEAFSGLPFSVGVVELKFAEGHGPILYPDQPLFLDSGGQRVLYTAFDVTYQGKADKSTMKVDRLRVLFLLRGNQRSSVSIAGLEGVELKTQEISFVEDSVRHGQLLREWWKAFSVIPRDLDREQKMLKQSLLEMLARRLALPGPWPSVQAMESERTSDLEGQFERAIGMLFGIESVKLAMQEDADLNESRHSEEADRPVPARPRMRSLPVPPVPASLRIEPIAMHVPAECFYLRTGNVANYRYFRRFLLGWGGSLDDIVATRSLDRGTRSRIELQLGLISDSVDVPEFDRSIADMALIGCDPFFQDGAAIGVLFHARRPEALIRQIQEQRQQAKRQVPEAVERRVDIDNHAVSLLASDDNRVRSFYAIDGQYHLVTNSRHLLSRFFEAGRGDQSLGALQEFRYARSKTQDRRNPLAFLYLSDPFFQNLVSPQYRIELTRRRQAAEELKQLRLARLVADAEQLDAVTAAELIEARLLPAEFADRPDNSIPLIKNGKLQDSLRGSPQAFLPVPDVPLDKATPSEVVAYQRFLQKYNQEWKRVDPVTVVFSRRDSRLPDHDWVNLDIVIAPYAQRRYSLLRQHLAAASPHRVAAVDGDLLSLDTSVRMRSGRTSHRLYLGLRDDTVPFAFENGSLRLLDRPEQGSYAKSHAYAAISPPSTELLRLLASVVGRQPAQRVPVVPIDRQANATPPAVGMPLGSMGQAFLYLGWSIGKMAFTYSDMSKALSSVETRGDWTVVSSLRKIRNDTFGRLTEERIETSSQVRLQMGSLHGAKVEPYIQAYTYLTARRASSENAKFLNDFSRWMHLPAKEARDAAEDVLGARVRCPLGGDFAIEEANGPPRWVGTDWREPSLHAVSEVPESWRFPFLDWLQRLHLQFDLDETTLRAQVDLLVNRGRAPAVDGETVRWNFDDPSDSIVTVNHERDMTVGSRPIANPTPAVATATTRSLGPARVRDGLSGIARAARKSRDSTSPRTWVLGVRLASPDESFRVVDVYAESPASRAGLQAEDEIRAVDRERPRSHAELRQLLRSALESDGVAEVEVLRRGLVHAFKIPLVDR